MNFADELINCETREQAVGLIMNLKLSKKALMDFARSLDVYTRPDYSKTEIIDKIVESTVGVSLRNQAIRDTRTTMSRGSVPLDK